MSNERIVRPLLSICIPTYNGVSRLPDTLKYLSKALPTGVQNIEVIIVDNCSENDPYSIVKPYLQDIRWKYYRNRENIGYNYSIINIIKSLSNGIYTWLIGDDDWLVPTAINDIMQQIEDTKVEYISIGHRIVKNEDFSIIEDYIETEKKLYDCSFEIAIEMNCSNSNVLGTFMSSAIFKTDSVKEFDFSQFNKDTWTDFKSVFPIGYIMAHTFNKSSCKCITTPEIICIPHRKSWDDKIIFMNSCILPSLYDNFTKSLNLKLPNNEEIIRLCELSTIKKRIKLSYKLRNLIHLSYFITRAKTLYMFLKQRKRK